MAVGNLFGLSAQAKARLIEKLASAAAAKVAPADLARAAAGPGEGRLNVAELEGSRDIHVIKETADFLGISNPFFRVHEGIAGAETAIDGQSYINFATYNYVGLNGRSES